VGLTKDPKRLVQIRRNRLRFLEIEEDTDYIDIDKVSSEVSAFSRRAGLFVVAALGMACEDEPSPVSQTPPPSGARAQAPPNIVLITVDTLRRDHLGTYGYARATSPFLDALSARAVVFRHAVAQGSWTFTALPALLTSRFPQEHAAFSVPRDDGGENLVGAIAPDSPSLAQHLRTMGYGTTLVSGHGGLASILGLKRGFDSVHIGSASAVEVTDTALAKLRRHGSEPVFLWLHYMDPHLPYRPPAPFDTRFVNDGKFVTHREVPPGDDCATDSFGGRRDLDFYVAQYDGSIAYADEQIGRVLAALHDLQMERNTIVVVTADHGESLGEHGRYCAHRYNLHSPILDIPLILAWPGTLQPRVVETTVMAVDIVPTLAELVQDPDRDRRWVGRNLAECARGAACPVRDAFAVQGAVAALRTDAWKLICPVSNDVCSLYDVVRDPMETLDVSAMQPEVLDALRRRLRFWLQEHPSPSWHGSKDLAREQMETLLDQLRALGYI
jgi:arylsulfatase A-like enzyme